MRRPATTATRPRQNSYDGSSVCCSEARPPSRYNIWRDAAHMPADSHHEGDGRRCCSEAFRAAMSPFRHVTASPRMVDERA